MLGADFEVLTTGDVTYITPQTNFINPAYPGSAEKVVSFAFNFSDTGTYDLYARVRVGSGTYNDDSFFAGNSLGEKSPVSGSDWLLINGIVPVGFTGPDEVVTGGGKCRNTCLEMDKYIRIPGWHDTGYIYGRFG